MLRYSSIVSVLAFSGLAAAEAQPLDFQIAGTYALPGPPVSIAAGDFDGSGSQDFAVAAYGPTATVEIFLNDGKGQFGHAATLDGVNGARTLATGDFNRDGRLDLAASALRLDLMIYLGNGDGTFQTARILPSVVDATQKLVVRDVNHDGTDDLIAGFNAGYALENAWVGTFIGNGDGSFQPAVKRKVGERMRSMVVDRFDSDNHHDVAWTSWISDKADSLLGSSAGAFSPEDSEWIGGSGRSILSGDLDGDGVVDLVAVVNNSIPYLAPMIGNGDGTFVFGDNDLAIGNPSIAAISDFNCDGKLDVVMDFERNASPSIFFMLGDGGGGFAVADTFGAGGSPWELVPSDVNGDAWRDLAVANYHENTLTILVNAIGTNRKGQDRCAR